MQKVYKMADIHIASMVRNIAEAIAKGEHTVYWIHHKMSSQDVSELVRYFKDKPEISIETSKCPDCRQLWTIIARF